MKILIADHDLYTRQNLKKILTKQEFQIAEAKNSDEVICIIKAFKPDAIILNTDIEPINGFTLCKKILRSNHKIKIIFVSKKEDEITVSKSYEAGAIKIFSKPFQLNAITQVFLELGHNYTAWNKDDMFIDSLEDIDIEEKNISTEKTELENVEPINLKNLSFSLESSHSIITQKNDLEIDLKREDISPNISNPPTNRTSVTLIEDDEFEEVEVIFPLNKSSISANPIQKENISSDRDSSLDNSANTQNQFNALEEIQKSNTPNGIPVNVSFSLSQKNIDNLDNQESLTTETLINKEEDIDKQDVYFEKIKNIPLNTEENDKFSFSLNKEFTQVKTIIQTPERANDRTIINYNLNLLDNEPTDNKENETSLLDKTNFEDKKDIIDETIPRDLSIRPPRKNLLVQKNENVDDIIINPSENENTPKTKKGFLNKFFKK